MKVARLGLKKSENYKRQAVEYLPGALASVSQQVASIILCWTQVFIYLVLFNGSVMNFRITVFLLRLDRVYWG